MTQSLFRQEAIEAHRAHMLGKANLSLPLPLTLMTVFLCLCIAGLGAFVATGSYARKEKVPGFLVTHLGVANIIAPRTGTIAALYVKEGQIVEQGAPLMSVNAEQSSEAGVGIDSAILASLYRQRSQLNEQVDLEHRRAEGDTQRLQAEIDGFTAEIGALQQEEKVQAERIIVAKEQVESVAELSKKGIVSQFELKKRQDNYLSIQQAGLVLNRTIAETQRNLGLRRGDLAQLPVDAERQISQLRSALNDIDVKIRQIDGQRAYLITAPKTGRVSALQAWTGKTAETNIPQMSIVPEDDSLSAELFVPARAIGFIANGQSVHIGYASFPYQQFGFALGTVETVSHTLLKPDQAVGPLMLTAPAYRVSVALKHQTITAYGKELPLQADMQLDGEIVFERRGLLAWLFDPLLATWRRAA